MVDENLIYPDEKETVKYWTEKWGISVRELYDAILETGSINANEIGIYLKKKGMIASHNFIKALRFW